MPTGGIGSKTSFTHSEETRKKIAVANKISHKGLKASTETRKKMSLAKLGIKRGPYKKYLTKI